MFVPNVKPTDIEDKDITNMAGVAMSKTYGVAKEATVIAMGICDKTRTMRTE